MSRGRIQRTAGLGPFKPHRKALQALLADFGSRCAYCLTHSIYVNGDNSFVVDHFRPTSRGGHGTAYENLYLSCDKCNCKKRDHWPNRLEVSRGLRFLDCCNEQDYNDQILEGADGSLVGMTVPAKYHIEIIDLNRPDLLNARCLRTSLLRELEKVNSGEYMIRDVTLILEKVDSLRKLVANLIPSVAAPPVTGQD